MDISADLFIIRMLFAGIRSTLFIIGILMHRVN